MGENNDGKKEELGANFCPFCGSENVSLAMDDFRGGEAVALFIQCQECNASGPIALLPKTAVTLWNARYE